jgi:hypothetical protein
MNEFVYLLHVVFHIQHRMLIIYCSPGGLTNHEQRNKQHGLSFYLSDVLWYSREILSERMTKELFG